MIPAFVHQLQSQSIEQQLERLQEAVAQHLELDLAPEHIYRDDGYTGAKLNRLGLDRLRGAAGMATFELVLVTAPDRLAHKYVHQVLLVEELHNPSWLPFDLVWGKSDEFILSPIR